MKTLVGVGVGAGVGVGVGAGAGPFTRMMSLGDRAERLFSKICPPPFKFKTKPAGVVSRAAKTCATEVKPRAASSCSLSCPLVKSGIKFSPNVEPETGAKLKISLPLPPVRVLFPVPPVITSFPAPPSIKLLPLPVLMVSLPSPPLS